MTKNQTHIALTRKMETFAQIDAFDPAFDRVTAGLAMSVSLRILFVGRGGVAGWVQLRDAIERLFVDLVEIKAISDISDLGRRGAMQADIVVVQGTTARCGAKTRVKIREVCPLASTVYVTTARQPSDPSNVDPDAVYLVKSCPVPPKKILDVMLDAMRRRICCLKLALRSPDSTNTPSETSLLERLFTLTPQELRVLVDVRRGMPNKVIARHLQITVRTVKAHLTEIFSKTGVTQRAELIVRCSELVAISDEPLKDDVACFRPRKDWAAASPFPRHPAPRPSLGSTSGNPTSPPHVPRVSPYRANICADPRSKVTR